MKDGTMTKKRNRITLSIKCFKSSEENKKEENGKKIYDRFNESINGSKDIPNI